MALNATKGPSGSNHVTVHQYAAGDGVTVGVLDVVFFGIESPNYLGSRLLAQYDFYNKTPSQTPDPLLNPNDFHETLAAHAIASNDPLYTGVAPAASIVNAAINDLNLDSRRAASAWLRANANTRIFNLSASFGPNTNGIDPEALYWDWFGRTTDSLLVVAAGNSGYQITIPADSYNGISVGAMDDATSTRWGFSAYALNGGIGGTEVRGKPDILAPGVNITDGISADGHPFSGTSFAAPHVAGAAALVSGYASDHPTSDVINHRGIKALIMNSARKRYVTSPEILSPVSYDAAASDAAFDKDYLSCAPGCTIANPGSPPLTQSWTPSGWTYDGTKLSVSKPLDDEQGVGFLDATRVIINQAAGNYGPGQVAGIGWDQSTIATTDLPASHTYSLHQTLAAGSFLTATLVWDRIANELDGNGIVNDLDTYTFGELANLDLRVLNGANQVIAESISTTDNVEHLHFPLPTNGNPDDYKLQVIYNGGGILATDFALAWWTDPTPLVPGDYNLDGTVNVSDYDVWRANFGTSTATSPLLHADGDANGHVDAGDYVLWRNHVGESWAVGSGIGSGGAVPEPSTLIMMSLASLSMVNVSDRRSRSRQHSV